jgi:hypothetical protein
MAYTVLSNKDTGLENSQGAGTQIASAAAQLLGNFMRSRRREAVQKALESEGYEKKVTLDESGKIKNTAYQKPKPSKLSMKESFAQMMGYDKLSREELADKAQNDPIFRQTVLGIKDTPKKKESQLEEDIGMAQKGSMTWEELERKYALPKDRKLIREAKYEATGGNTRDLLKAFDKAIETKKYTKEEVVKDLVLGNYEALEKDGYDVSEIIKKYAVDIRDMGLEESVPEEYKKTYNQIAGTLPPKKKFNWSNLTSPIAAVSNFAEGIKK